MLASVTVHPHRRMLVRALLCALLAAWCCAQPPPPPSPPRPQLPPEFTAKGFQLLDSGTFRHNLTGAFFYTERYNRSLQISNSPFSGMPTLFGIYLDDSSQLQTINGQCRHMPGEFWPLWSIVPYMSYAGPSEPMSGVKCDRWLLAWTDDDDGEEESIVIDVLQSDSTRPVQYNITFTASGWPDPISMVFGYPPWSFFEPSLKSELSPPPGCSKTPFYCESGPVVTIPMIRYHSSADYSLWNTNTADAVGDTSFMCPDIANNVQPDYDVVTLFNVTVNSTWGQYQLCNHDVCRGGIGKAVGRERSYGVSYMSGQCDTDVDETGVWYSLPAEGECRGNRKVGDDGCTWRLDKQVKTITADCLRDRDFVVACQKDNFSFPFASSVQVLQQALDSDDPENGGCPPVDTAAARRMDGGAAGRGAPARRMRVEPMRPSVENVADLLASAKDAAVRGFAQVKQQ